jgi:hypothetical protein
MELEDTCLRRREETRQAVLERRRRGQGRRIDGSLK